MDGYITEGRPDLSLSSTNVLPFLNLSCHLNTSDLLHFAVVDEDFNIFNVSDGVLSKPTQNFVTARISTSPVDAIVFCQ